MALPGSHFTLNVYFLLFQVSLAYFIRAHQREIPSFGELIKQLQSVITPWIQPPLSGEIEKAKERKGWVTFFNMTSCNDFPGSQDLDQAFCSPIQHFFCHIMVHIPRHEWKNTSNDCYWQRCGTYVMTLQAYT